MSSDDDTGPNRLCKQGSDTELRTRHENYREIIQEQGVIFERNFIIAGRGERLSIANKSWRGVGVLGGID